MPGSLRHRYPARARWCVPLGVALFAAFHVSGTQAAADASVAQSSPDAREYSIAAGPLTKALNQFAETNGLVLVYPASLASGLSTAGLTGHYTLREALARLLEGTGLTYRFTKREQRHSREGARGQRRFDVEYAQRRGSPGGRWSAGRFGRARQQWQYRRDRNRRNPVVHPRAT